MAKNKFATRALNSKDEPILVTMELQVSTMDIDVKSFPIPTLSDSDVDDFINRWTNGEVVEFPEHTFSEKRAFTDESLLPDTIKLEGKTGAVRQLQNEWSYLILNSKLYEQFMTELDMIKQKAGELKSFDHELFDEAKNFWEKILEYKKEREISQEKLNFFKEEINTVFDHLKHLKESLIKEKDEISEKIKIEFNERLNAIQAKLDGGGVHFKTLMDELKELQAKLRSEDVKRDIKNILFEKIQGSFEKIKVKRDEVLGGANNSRISGLQTVLERIQKTLTMDQKDLDFNVKKLDSVNNKLELQLREAKINVLKDRISSKEEKIADIAKTLQKLSKKTTAIKEVIIEEAEEIIKEVKQEAEGILEAIGDKFEDLKDKFEAKIAEQETKDTPETPEENTTAPKSIEPSEDKTKISSEDAD